MEVKEEDATIDVDEAMLSHFTSLADFIELYMKQRRKNLISEGIRWVVNKIMEKDGKATSHLLFKLQNHSRMGRAMLERLHEKEFAKLNRYLSAVNNKAKSHKKAS